MDTEYQILILLLIHYVADFRFQTDWMALNKSKEFLPLATHVFIYALTFFVCGIFIFDFIDVLTFCLVTFIAHIFTDLITSQITTQLYKEERFRAFFNVIGFDQFLHAVQLILTYKFIFQA
jgi:hypothetical protein